MIISQSERDIRKGEVKMSGDDMEDLIVHADVFKKYLQKAINEYQALLGGGQMQGKEAKAYMAFEIIGGLIDGLGKSEKNYKKFIEENSK